MVQIEHNGGKFQFTRNADGEGNWVCVEGNVPGLLGGVNRNVIVPIMFGNELTSIAIQMGHKREALTRFVKKEEKPKKRRTVRAARKKQPAGISLDF